MKVQWEWFMEYGGWATCDFAEAIHRLESGSRVRAHAVDFLAPRLAGQVFEMKTLAL